MAITENTGQVVHEVTALPYVRFITDILRVQIRYYPHPLLVDLAQTLFNATEIDITSLDVADKARQHLDDLLLAEPAEIKDGFYTRVQREFPEFIAGDMLPSHRDIEQRHGVRRNSLKSTYTAELAASREALTTAVLTNELPRPSVDDLDDFTVVSEVEVVREKLWFSATEQAQQIAGMMPTKHGRLAARVLGMAGMEHRILPDPDNSANLHRAIAELIQTLRTCIDPNELGYVTARSLGTKAEEQAAAHAQRNYQEMIDAALRNLLDRLNRLPDIKAEQRPKSSDSTKARRSERNVSLSDRAKPLAAGVLRRLVPQFTAPPVPAATSVSAERAETRPPRSEYMLIPGVGIGKRVNGHYEAETLPGLDNLEPENLDVAVAALMGTRPIIDWLSDQPTTRDATRQILRQLLVSPYGQGTELVVNGFVSVLGRGQSVPTRCQLRRYSPRKGQTAGLSSQQATKLRIIYTIAGKGQAKTLIILGAGHKQGYEHHIQKHF